MVSCAPLRWYDIDLERGAVTFARALAEGVAGGPVVVPTKNRRRNRAEVDELTRRALVDHHCRAVRQAAASGMSLPSEGYVFARDAAGVSPWKPNWVTEQFGTAS